MNVRSKREIWQYYLFLLPAYLIFGIFIFWPVIQSFYLSFFRYNIMTIQAPEYVGIKNYKFLFQNEVFWISVKNILIFTLGTIPIKLVLGLAIALLLSSKLITGKRFYRACFYIPVIAPMVAVSIVWAILFDPNPNGVVNTILAKLFKIGPFGWASDSRLALPTVMLVVIWKDLGYIMTIYLAGLAAIPQEIYEAAALDPISTWQKVRYITLPLLKPTTMFLLITQIISSFQVFTPVYVITGGGPGYSSTTIINYLYEIGFKNYDMGLASAIACLLFIVLLLLTVLQNKISKSEEITFD